MGLLNDLRIVCKVAMADVDISGAFYTMGVIDVEQERAIFLKARFEIRV